MNRNIISKKKATIIYFSSIIMLLGCNVNNGLDLKNNLRENYLVDKITYFETSSNYKTTKYFYNKDNKLIKRLTTGKLFENNQVKDLKYVDEFEYENGLVSKIRVRDSTHFKFSYDIELLYDSEKNLIKQEIWKNGVLISQSNFHYENNKMVSIYNDDTEPFETNTITYDNQGNVKKHTYLDPKKNLIGEPIEGEYEWVEYLFEYDNGSRPNFGIDYLFVYEPLIGIGNETFYSRQLSLNNLTKHVYSGTTWTFNYDESGLPTQVEMKWKGIETHYPMIFEITNKQID